MQYLAGCIYCPMIHRRWLIRRGGLGERLVELPSGQLPAGAARLPVGRKTANLYYQEQAIRNRAPGIILIRK